VSAATGLATENCGPLLDYEAAAEYLATTPRHVSELRSQQRIAVIKVGKLVRFRRSDLDDYIKKNLNEATR
jgi:excisionase family DNA binding protein